MNEYRCFIALELPEAVQEFMQCVINKLKRADADVSWVKPPRRLSEWELKLSIIPAWFFIKTAATDPFVSVGL